MERRREYIEAAECLALPKRSLLFKHLLPMYQQKTGVQVRVVALGTGQALDLARRGDWRGVQGDCGGVY